MNLLYINFLTRKKIIFAPLMGFFFCCLTITGFAQTCTNNDPACSSALPDLNALLTGGTNTLVTVGSGTLFTATQTSTTTSLEVNSGKYRVTSTDGCVLVSFTEVRIGTATGPTNVSIVTSNNTVITCPNVNVNAITGKVCVKICDPVNIINGDLIRIRLTFSATTGDFTSTSVQITALAVLNLAVNITCPTNFICLDQSDCPAISTCGPGVLVGKIRVFFPTPIPVGTPTPVVTAVLNGAITLNEFKLCVSADAGTNVVRTFVDYCVYSTAVIPLPLPITALSLTLQSGLFDPLTCALSLTPLICPTGFSQIMDGRPCSPCDVVGFPNAVGKIRVFFPTAIPAGVPTPIITSVIDAAVTLGQFKLCAFADVGTNVARTFADYCIYSNAIGSIFPFLSTTLSLEIQTNSCTPLTPQVCPVISVTLPPCPSFDFQVLGTVNSSGGTSGNLGSCVSTTTCNGSLLYLASRVRLNISPCLAIGIPAPTITSFQTVDAMGNLSLLNQDYCFVVSDESAAAIGTSRCFIEYCVYSKVLGNTFFENPPATLVFNVETTTSVPGGPLITTTCNAANIGGPLPVTLLDFNYQLKDCGVVLKWSTTQEINSKEFVLQNSTNGITWTSIGKVNARGNSTNRSDYTFVHQKPAAGQNFYRFAAVDIDGKSKYSSVISAKVLCGGSGYTINPNPFTDHVNISFASLKVGSITISLLDNTGRQVYRAKKNVQNGANQIKINNLNHLPQGLYILSIKTDDAVINERLIK